jgi:uncharacterized protein (TIGR03435 family)
MKKLLLWMWMSLLMSGAALQAQELVGQWQGTLHQGNNDLRLIMKVFKGDNSALKADFFAVDHPGQPIHATSITRDGTSIKIAINMMGVNYEGALSADGKTINGTWTQANPLPLNFTLSTKETAWEIPAPPPPPKLMATGANPTFDVATIKPNDSNATHMQGLNILPPNKFRTRASSLTDLIEFAYQIQDKQLVGAPDWANKDRYDVDAIPDTEGLPNPEQVRIMMRKLLADRFGLKFHHEKRELSAFTLMVAKTGSKLKPTESTGPLPGIGMGPGKGGTSLRLFNGNLDEFISFLQTRVLDRPVVNQTGLTGRYDLVVTFTPDDSMPGVPVIASKTEDATETAPSLFEAFQQQLGLKLTAEKTPVDVIVIDHVEKPSAN